MPVRTRWVVQCALWGAWVLAAGCGGGDDPQAGAALRIESGTSELRVMVGPEGAILVLGDDARVRIPEGALDEAVEIRAALAEDSDIEAAEPAGTRVGKRLLLEPHGQTFRQTIEVELRVTKEGARDADLDMHWLKTAADPDWSEAPGSTRVLRPEARRELEDADEVERGIRSSRRLLVESRTFSVYTVVEASAGSGGRDGGADSGDGLGEGGAGIPDATLTDTGARDAAAEVDAAADGALPSTSLPGGWSFTVSGPGDALSADAPAAAINASGDIVISWFETADHMMFTERVGGTWQHPTDTDFVSVGGSNNVTPHPSLADNGAGIITWVSNVGGTGVYMSTRSAAGVWSHPAQASDRVDFDGQIGGYVSSDIAADGAGIVTWTTANQGVYAAPGSGTAFAFPTELTERLDVDGTDINGGTGTGYPRVASGGNNKTVAAWLHNDGTGQVVRMAVLGSGGWVRSEANPAPGTRYQNIKVAVGSGGEAIVAYVALTAGWADCSGCAVLYVSEYDGATWTHPAAASDAFSHQQSESSRLQVGDTDLYVGVADSGDAAVVWHQEVSGTAVIDGDSSHIYVATRDGGTWTMPGPLDRVDFPSRLGQNYPFTAAMGANGDVLIARAGQDNSSAPPQLHAYAVQRVGGNWYVPEGEADLLQLVGDGFSQPFAAVSASGEAVLVCETWDADNSSAQIGIGTYAP